MPVARTPAECARHQKRGFVHMDEGFVEQGNAEQTQLQFSLDHRACPDPLSGRQFALRKKRETDTTPEGRKVKNISFAKFLTPSAAYESIECDGRRTF